MWVQPAEHLQGLDQGLLQGHGVARANDGVNYGEEAAWLHEQIFFTTHVLFQFTVGQPRKLPDGSEGLGSEKLPLVMPHDWVKSLEENGVVEAALAERD